MSAPGGPRGILGRAGARLVGALLSLFPRRFRARFGDDQRTTLELRLAEAERRGTLPLLAAVGRSAVDVLVAALREHVRPTVGPEASAGRSGAPFEGLAQDLRFSVRSLMRRPGFTFVALFTLAVGIGATTAVFSMVNGILLEPLPYPEPDRLVMVWSHDEENPEGRGWISLPDLDDVRGVDALSAVEGWQGITLTVTEGGAAERIRGTRVTGGLLEVFGLAPARGRDLTREENRTDAPRVVVVGHRFWQGRLGGDPEVVGKTLELSELPHQIVGVAPPGFDYPEGTQLWIPYRHDLEGCPRGCEVYRAVGRLAPGVGPEGGREPLLALARSLEESHPRSNAGKRFRTESLLEVQVGSVRLGLWVILGAVGLVLLIVCANLANLLLVRASTRRGEVAVRAALGASRGRLLRQVLTESGLLAAVGGGVGVLLSMGIVEGFRAVAPVSLPRMEQVGVDGPVLLFALAVSGAVALLFGTVPAVRLARTEPAEQLTGGGRGGRRHEGRSRRILMAAEIALSLALLAGAGLLTRSLVELYRVELGFHGRDVVRMSVSLPDRRYDSLPAFTAFFQELEGRLAALPGVEAVGSSFGGPLTSGNIGGGVRVEGRPEPEPGEGTQASVRPVTPGYMEALGLTLLRGRGILETDRLDSEPVAVVNETFLAQNFPDGEALGERIRVGAHFGYGGNVYRTVVGVVRDVRGGLTAEPRPALYVPHTQFGPGFLDVYVRGGPEPGAVVSAARRELRRLDPALVLGHVETIREAIRGDAASTRFYLLLVGVFAAVSVLLAAVGLYGVVAYAVSRRTREIGIRVALGARVGEILGMVARQGLASVLAGLVLGLAAALAGGRLMAGLLFEVRPADPLVLGGATALVAGVAFLAVLLPSRRALSVDPTEALRSE